MGLSSQNQSEVIERRTLNRLWRHFVSLKSELGSHAASEVFCYAKDRGIDMSARVSGQSEPKVWNTDYYSLRGRGLKQEPNERESMKASEGYIKKDRFREAYNLQHPLRRDPNYNPVAQGLLCIYKGRLVAREREREAEAELAAKKPAAVPLVSLDPACTTIVWDRGRNSLSLNYRLPYSGCSFYAELKTTDADTRKLAEDALRYRMAKWLGEKART